MCKEWGDSVAWFKSAEKASHTELCKEFEIALTVSPPSHLYQQERPTALDRQSGLGRERDGEERRTKLKMESKDKQNIFMSLSSLAFI